MERYIIRKSILYEVEKFVGKVRLTLSDDSVIEGDEIPIILREEQIKHVEQASK